MKLGCLACHSTDGSVKIGPTWKDLYGSKVTLSDGSTVTADDNYIRESILVPGAKIVKGFPNVMPTFKGIIKDDEITAVIAYLKTLSTTGPDTGEGRREDSRPGGPGPASFREDGQGAGGEKRLSRVPHDGRERQGRPDLERSLRKQGPAG